MPPRVVYDTNVIVSAVLKAGSIPSAVVAFVLDGRVQLYLSRAILDEYTDVLKRPKFGLDAGDVERLLQDLTRAARTVTPTRRVTAAPDEADNRFLECARKARASFLVTGNRRHFPFPEFEGTQIVTPAAFVQIMVA